MKKLFSLFLLIVFTGSLMAQQPKRERFSVYKATTLAGAVETVTIQQPLTGALDVFFEYAILYCSVVCTIELEIDGTAATTSALTPIVETYGTATATAWSGSDVGNGTTLYEYNLAAGETITVSLIGQFLEGDGTAKNLSFRTNSITGDVKIAAFWWEQ